MLCNSCNYQSTSPTHQINWITRLRSFASLPSEFLLWLLRFSFGRWFGMGSRDGGDRFGRESDDEFDESDESGWAMMLEELESTREEAFQMLPDKSTSISTPIIPPHWPQVRSEEDRIVIRTYNGHTFVFIYALGCMSRSRNIFANGPPMKLIR